MRRHALPVPILLFLIGPAFLLGGQFTPLEIAQREEIERFLLEAEIVKSESVGEGVTKPMKIHLKKGDVEGKAVWKNPTTQTQGVLDEWRFEIAAYRIDKLIGLNMVPPTVERMFEKKKGSLQFWVESRYSLLDIQEKAIPIPASAAERVNDMKYLTRAFDSLIANEDRTQQNVRYTEDWRTILIDHSRAFRSSDKFTKALMFGAHGIKRFGDGRPFLFRRLARAFVEKIKGLTFENLKEAVGNTLADKEIRAVLARRILLLRDIDEMIKEQGEDKVLTE